jgi:hypothetical protein
VFEDVSPNFVYNPIDAHIGTKLIELEEKPEQIKYFESVAHELSDYAYWFFLTTCWVSYTGHSDIELWKKLFLITGN